MARQCYSLTIPASPVLATDRKLKNPLPVRPPSIDNTIPAISAMMQTRHLPRPRTRAARERDRSCEVKEAQLSDDCLLAFGGPICRRRTRRNHRRGVTPVRIFEPFSLRPDADGRILAKRHFRGRCRAALTNSARWLCCAHVDLPPQGEQAFSGKGTLQAGASTQEPAIRPRRRPGFSTGAPMPEAPTTVFMQEDVRRR